MAEQLPTDCVREALPVDDAARIAGTSRTHLYREWKAGRGPRFLQHGRGRRVTRTALFEWLSSLERTA